MYVLKTLYNIADVYCLHTPYRKFLAYPVAHRIAASLVQLINMTNCATGR